MKEELEDKEEIEQDAMTINMDKSKQGNLETEALLEKDHQGN